MPRTKAAPSRRADVEQASAGQGGVKLNSAVDLDQEYLTPKLDCLDEVEPQSPRPTKRRRKSLPQKQSESDVQVAISEEQEVLGFLELTDAVGIAAQPQRISAAVVRVSSADSEGSLALLSLELRSTDGTPASEELVGPFGRLRFDPAILAILLP
ncbi:hypothetical protein Agub_g3966 [Astrephomene gubernaculifera]|uniref:Uncharacterized protein n=1 Tax=Astrephomene gubernaculifera TaxID=47775 RepID=A0AAD3DLU9_9CHLO|nr:hypothetical protein Agub_g3966 [Astrephomene gubernaculifera]